MIRSFLDLEVYKESFQLSLEIDEIVQKFPKSEEYLLCDQMKRASRAIPSAIAEGYAKRDSVPEFKRFLRIGIGEANEMINHLAFSKAKRYIPSEKAELFINRYHVVGKKLTGLKDKWRKF